MFQIDEYTRSIWIKTGLLLAVFFIPMLPVKNLRAQHTVGNGGGYSEIEFQRILAELPLKLKICKTSVNPCELTSADLVQLNRFLEQIENCPLKLKFDAQLSRKYSLDLALCPSTVTVLNSSLYQAPHIGLSTKNLVGIAFEVLNDFSDGKLDFLIQKQDLLSQLYQTEEFLNLTENLNLETLAYYFLVQPDFDSDFTEAHLVLAAQSWNLNQEVCHVSDMSLCNLSWNEHSFLKVQNGWILSFYFEGSIQNELVKGIVRVKLGPQSLNPELRVQFY